MSSGHSSRWSAVGRGARDVARRSPSSRSLAAGSNDVVEQDRRQSTDEHKHTDRTLVGPHPDISPSVSPDIFLSFKPGNANGINSGLGQG